MVRKLPSSTLSLKSFMNDLNADIFCFQETKMSLSQLEPSLQFIDGYESFWSFSTAKKGYSGVVTFARTGLTVDAQTTIGESRFDDEGRVMMTDHHNFVLFNVYFPNSGMGLDRLRYKLEFYEKFLAKCTQLRDAGKHVVVVGDVNTAYEDIDIWNNEYTGSDVFSQERVWMKKWYASGFVDGLRVFQPNKPGFYTWFDPLNPDYRRLNKGWRLDYAVCDQIFAEQNLLDCGIITDGLAHNLSDHVPIYIKFKQQPEVPTHPIPALSSLNVQKKQPSLHAFFKPKSIVIDEKEGSEEAEKEYNAQEKEKDKEETVASKDIASIPNRQPALPTSGAKRKARKMPMQGNKKRK